MLRKLIFKLKVFYIKKIWIKKFKNNSISIGKIGNNATYNFIKSNLYIGEFSYGVLNVHSSGAKNEKLIIGNFCQISSQSHFLMEGEHPLNTLTTYPIEELILNKEISSFTKGPIILEDEVWIGCNALILSGVKIGKGAVISAGAVVTKNVPPYAIVGGIPARVIRYRFSNTIIDKLLQVKLDFNKIKNSNIDIKPIDESNIDYYIEKMCVRKDYTYND